MNRLPIAAVVFLLGVAVARPASAQTPRQPAGSIRVSGVLVVDDLPEECASITPAIWLHKVPPTNEHPTNELQFAIEVGADGVVLNPSAQPDSRGLFTMRVRRSFLPSDGRIYLSVWCAVGPNDSRHWPLQSKATGVVVIVIRPGAQAMNLGRLTILGH